MKTELWNCAKSKNVTVLGYFYLHLRLSDEVPRPKRELAYITEDGITLSHGITIYPTWEQDRFLAEHTDDYYRFGVPTFVNEECLKRYVEICRREYPEYVVRS